VRNMLVDAGPLIALFSPTDKHHEYYDLLLAYCEPTGLRLVTTWPCIVEASYFLQPARRFDLLQWIARGGLMVYPFDVRHLSEMVVWMQHYTEPNKCEMDLADASLYWLAADTGITEIMTVDLRDFQRYQLPNGQRFNIV